MSQLVKNERSYYEQVVSSSRRQLMLYPYHLSEPIVAGLRVSPFQYYSAALLDIMDQEKSYDALPNFTAVDCVRLLGIGRNQYIELMNQRKSTGRSRLLFSRKTGKDLLPTLPSPGALQHMQPWWIVKIGRVTQSDVKSNVTATEKVVIDLLIDNGAQKAGDIDKASILSLYGKGLIYLDVPLTENDRVTVPPLEGFVMNRVTGDPMESLLYRVFISIDEHSSLAELGSVLGTSKVLITLALSLFCRLGFAQRKSPIPSFGGIEANSDFSSDALLPLHPSWDNLTSTTTTGRYNNNSSLGTPTTATGVKTQEDMLLLELQSALADDYQYLSNNLESPAGGGAVVSPLSGNLAAATTPSDGGGLMLLPSATTPEDVSASLQTPLSQVGTKTLLTYPIPYSKNCRTPVSYI